MLKRVKELNQHDDELLSARVRDAFDAACRYDTKFIGFLDPQKVLHAKRQAAALCEQAAYEGCTYKFFGGYDDAERVFLGVFPPYSQPCGEDFPIKAIHIEWRFKSLTHRDFLGALLALGIVRDKIGDIVVGDGKCTVFAEKTVAQFIIQNLSKVGAAGVRCEETNGVSTVREEHFKNMTGTVASCRLDCVVSVLTGCSRSASAELIAEGLVSVDYDARCDNSYEISGGATVSIRGHGRFVVDSLGPPTKKGRLAFAARKYL